MVAIVLATGFGLWRWSSDRYEEPPRQTIASNQEPQTAPPQLPPLPRAKSRYLNTTSQAQYVGNAACQSCHAEEHQSYELTGHSRALAKVDESQEPEDAEYYHQASGRWYQVFRQEGQLRHRESVRFDNGGELVLNDHAVQWVIGSGRFSKSYLVEQDGFLTESPITWYAANQRWSMSPGFDRASHMGFRRLADQGCLVCHAGQVTAHDGNAFRPRIEQMTIGCESCHGPGSLHVERRTQSSATSDEEDLTIVNPRHLSRELSESVCASCHLRGTATVFRRGLGLNDMRPGLPLTDVRIDYGLMDPSGEMEVVGHVEQMRLSRCYTESQTMTCITCHDPHSQPTAAERVSFYRQACLQCHSDEDCGQPVLERLQVDKQDNCVTCHMPTTDTDIPHFAFTHHRIATPADHAARSMHDNQSPALSLTPLADVSQLSLAERDRALGLAYIEFAEKQPAHYTMLLGRAIPLLKRGEPDGDSAAALAQVLWELGGADRQAAAQAERALMAPELSTQSKSNALVVRGSARLQAGQAAAAAADFERLTRLQRHPGYWLLLADARLAQGDRPAAARALEQAVRIAPEHADYRRQLAELYTSLGRRDQAAEQRQAIQTLNTALPAQR
jgi:hypothetical protein